LSSIDEEQIILRFDVNRFKVMQIYARFGRKYGEALNDEQCQALTPKIKPEEKSMKRLKIQTQIDYVLDVELSSKVFDPEMLSKLETQVKRQLDCFVVEMSKEVQHEDGPPHHTHVHQLEHLLQILREMMFHNHLLVALPEIDALLESFPKEAIKLHPRKGRVSIKMQSDAYHMTATMILPQDYPSGEPIKVKISHSNFPKRFNKIFQDTGILIAQSLFSGEKSEAHVKSLLYVPPVTEDTNLKEEVEKRKLERQEHRKRTAISYTQQQRIKMQKQAEKKWMEGKMTALKLRLQNREKIWKQFEDQISRDDQRGNSRNEQQEGANAKPSLLAVATYLYEQCCNRMTRERCCFSAKKLLPENPDLFEDKVEGDAKRIERLYCGHYAFFGKVKQYVHTPPFSDHKYCPVCPGGLKRVSHHLIEENLKQLERGHLRAQEKKREFDEVKDFLDF